MVTRSPTISTVPPAPPPAESLPEEQPRKPSALTLPAMITSPSSVALAANSTMRPPPLPARSAASKPSRQPLSPPADPNSLT
jgi:hypothetical protein